MTYRFPVRFSVVITLMFCLTACSDASSPVGGGADTLPADAGFDGGFDAANPDGGSDTDDSTSGPQLPWKLVTGGKFYACALDAASRLFCWGLGDNSNYDFGQISEAPSGEFRDLSAGPVHACAVNNAGAVI